MKSLLRNAIFLLTPATLVAQTITGSVRNGTTNKPSSGDPVIVMRLSDSMEQESQTRSDSRGSFAIALKSTAGPHLLRAVHSGVNYDQAITDSTPVTITVFDSAARVAAVHGRLGIGQIEADGSRLNVTEMYSLVNPSSPPITQAGPKSFSFAIPREAILEFVQAKRERGVWINVTPLAVKDQPGRYAVDFPVRPGDTLFKFVYHLPYNGSAKLQFKPAYPVETFAVAHPPQMTFAARKAAFTNLGTVQGLRMEQVAAKGMLREIPAFEISGMGEVEKPLRAAEQSPVLAASAMPAGTKAALATGATPNRDIWALLAGFAALLSVVAFALIRSRWRHGHAIVKGAAASRWN
jgi:hypothetical protein